MGVTGTGGVQSRRAARECLVFFGCRFGFRGFGRAKTLDRRGGGGRITGVGAHIMRLPVLGRGGGEVNMTRARRAVIRVQRYVGRAEPGGVRVLAKALGRAIGGFMAGHPGTTWRQVKAALVIVLEAVRETEADENWLAVSSVKGKAKGKKRVRRKRRKAFRR